jgi:coenzyme PQQ precursor peptide PqqA
MPIRARRRMIPPPEQHLDRVSTIPSPTAIDFRFGFEITLYIANR